MTTSLAAVLELVDQLSVQDQMQVAEYLLAKTNENFMPITEGDPEPALLQQRLEEWLAEVETLDYEKPIARSGLKQEFEAMLVEKYRQQGLKL